MKIKIVRLENHLSVFRGEQEIFGKEIPSSAKEISIKFDSIDDDPSILIDGVQILIDGESSAVSPHRRMK
jgi:hypothetical protein